MLAKPAWDVPYPWWLCVHCGHPRILHDDDVCRVVAGEWPSCRDCAARLRTLAGQRLRASIIDAVAELQLHESCPFCAADIYANEPHDESCAYLAAIALKQTPKGNDQ